MFSGRIRSEIPAYPQEKYAGISAFAGMTGRARLPSRFMARPCFKIEKAFPEPLAGVDEAGCAPLAGPVVAAAVILDRKRFPRGIDDSKALPAPVREAICARLYKTARIGVGIASVEEIDRLNIYWARMLAMTRAVEALGMDPAIVLVDGNACPRWERPSRAIVAGDAKCRSIAAASIVAKVTRDRIRSEEHTSELQSLMRISYAVFCLKKNKN